MWKHANQRMLINIFILWFTKRYVNLLNLSEIYSCAYIQIYIYIYKNSATISSWIIVTLKVTSLKWYFEDSKHALVTKWIHFHVNHINDIPSKKKTFLFFVESWELSLLFHRNVTVQWIYKHYARKNDWKNNNFPKNFIKWNIKKV